MVETGLVCVSTYRNVEEIQKEVNFYAKGEDGQFCGSLLDLYRIRAR
jgi:hypothetical protein